MLASLKCENILPELTDDGLRLRRSEILVINRPDGSPPETNPEGFRLVAYENPILTADVLAIKRERQLIAEQNFRKYA